MLPWISSAWSRLRSISSGLTATSLSDAPVRTCRGCSTISLGGSSLLATIRRLPLALHRRAGNRSKGTEHTTVAGLRLEQSSAGSTRVEVAAGIQRHGLLGFSEAVGTAKNRAQFHTFY